MIDRKVTVRFDANVARRAAVAIRARAELDRGQHRRGRRPSTTTSSTRPRATITAQASYNVSPPTVGAYFNKINCFCFTEQRIKAGETRDMTVVFYVDPAIAKDRDQDDARHHHAVLHLLSGAASRQRPVADDAADEQNL